MIHSCTNCHKGDSNAYHYKNFNNYGYPREWGMFIMNDLTKKSKKVSVKKESKQIKLYESKIPI